MKNLKWRLSKLPTPDEVRELVKDKIITQEEAREILFSQEEQGTENIEAYKSEIKFLRELVEKISNRSQIVESIRYIEKPYAKWGWYQPYMTYCSGNLLNGTATNAIGNYTSTAMNTVYSYDNQTGAFTSIQTF